MKVQITTAQACLIPPGTIWQLNDGILSQITPIKVARWIMGFLPWGSEVFIDDQLKYIKSVRLGAVTRVVIAIDYTLSDKEIAEGSYVTVFEEE